MGYTQAAGINEAVNDGSISLETALAWHLQANHYPPVHPVFVDAALKAIEAAQFGEYDNAVELPNGKILTAGQIVEGLHLEAFL